MWSHLFLRLFMSKFDIMTVYNALFFAGQCTIGLNLVMSAVNFIPLKQTLFLFRIFLPTLSIGRDSFNLMQHRFYKVKVFWEGHIIWKKSPNWFCLLLNNINSKCDIIFSNFVAFSEYLNFSMYIFALMIYYNLLFGS